MRLLKVSCLVLTVSGVTLGAVGFWRTRCNATIVEALQAADLAKARALLDGYHDWKALVSRMEVRNSLTLWQAALDVQFEYRYIPADDTSYAYPENVESVKTLVAKGASPAFRHVLAATDQGKMQTARFFLDCGVPVTGSPAEGKALANAAYYGDCQLIEELLRRGIDVNHDSGRGWRPLLAAAWSDRYEATALLLRRGADPTMPYTVWEGHTEPIWMTIRDRAQRGRDANSVWQLVEANLRGRGNSEQDGAANGSQPFRSETNRTSSAAGSRR